MFDVEKFKNDFPSKTKRAMIDYVMENKDFYFEDVTNFGLRYRVETKGFMNAEIKKKIRKGTKYFRYIGFIIQKKDGKWRKNPKFIPLNQIKKP